MNTVKAIKIQRIRKFIGYASQLFCFLLSESSLLIVLTLIFYARLDLVLAVAMAALLVVMAWLIYALPVGIGFYIAIFVIAWVGQFYGHKVEGKKPSFFKDLQFLLIGPVWCMDAYLGKILPKWKSRQNKLITQ